MATEQNARSSLLLQVSCTRFKILVRVTLRLSLKGPFVSIQFWFNARVPGLCPPLRVLAAVREKTENNRVVTDMNSSFCLTSHADVLMASSRVPSYPT